MRIFQVRMKTNSNHDILKASILQAYDKYFRSTIKDKNNRKTLEPRTKESVEQPGVKT